MYYYNSDTHEWPLSKKQVQSNFPNVTFAAADWPPSPFYEVARSEAPAYNPLTHKLVETEPVEQDGTYVQGWSLVPYTVQETEANVEREVQIARAQAHARVNSAYTEKTNALAEGYPENEQKSWPIQVEEAKAFTADPNADVPWIENAATARGTTKSELVTLILAQDLAYREFHGALSGTRQALRNQIDAFATEEASIALLNAIDWPEE